MDCKDEHKRTPLHHAVSQSVGLCGNAASVETVSCLVENNASVNAKDVDKTTPLLMACLGAVQDKHICAQVVLLLLDSGASTTSKYSRDMAHPDHKNHFAQEGDTALIMAVKGGNIDVVDALLRRSRCLVNERGWEEITPLAWACAQKRIPVISRLLAEHRLDPTLTVRCRCEKLRRESKGCNSEHDALWYLNTLIVGDPNLSVQARKQPHFQLDNDTMGTHDIDTWTQIFIMLMDLKIKPNVNCPQYTDRGCTLLHWAASTWAGPEVLQQLLRKGADPLIKGYMGENTLHAAAENNRLDALLLLLKHTGLEQGLTKLNIYGDTILHIAIRMCQRRGGKVEEVVRLIEEMSQPSMCMTETGTPKHFKAPNQDSILWIDYPNNDGLSALQFACLGPEWPVSYGIICTPIVMALLKAGSRNRPTEDQLKKSSAQQKKVRNLLMQSSAAVPEPHREQPAEHTDQPAYIYLDEDDASGSERGIKRQEMDVPSGPERESKRQKSDNTSVLEKVSRQQNVDHEHPGLIIMKQLPRLVKNGQKQMKAWKNLCEVAGCDTDNQVVDLSDLFGLSFHPGPYDCHP